MQDFRSYNLWSRDCSFPEDNDVPVQRSYRGGNGGGVVCLVRWCTQKAKVVIVLAMER